MGAEATVTTETSVRTSSDDTAGEERWMREKRAAAEKVSRKTEEKDLVQSAGREGKMD